MTDTQVSEEIILDDGSQNEEPPTPASVETQATSLPTEPETTHSDQENETTSQPLNKKELHS
jgi:hypothetical protein